MFPCTITPPGVFFPLTCRNARSPIITGTFLYSCQRSTRRRKIGMPSGSAYAVFFPSALSVRRRPSTAEIFPVISLIAPCFFSHRSEEHTSELQSRLHLVCRLLLEKNT